jgi:hypothetical protein
MNTDETSGRCRATSKQSGERCKRRVKPGALVCDIHGGKTPVIAAAAARRRADMEARSAAENAVARLGLSREIAPDQALTEELHRTAGMVAWLGQVVAGMESGALVWGELRRVDRDGGKDGPSSEVTSGAAPSVWLQLWQAERKHLAAVARDAIAANVGERRVRLAEQQGALLAVAVRLLLERLDLSEAQWSLVPTVVPEVLRSVAVTAGGGDAQ